MHKKHCFTASAILFSFLLLSYSVQAQNEDSLAKKPLTDSLDRYVVRATSSIENEQNLHVFEKVDVEATVDMLRWRRQLEKNLTAPIEKAAKNGMKAGQYTVLVRFLVEKDGRISDVKALNDPGYDLTEASVNVVKSGPRWIAGKQNGRKVRSYHTQPITFVISEK